MLYFFTGGGEATRTKVSNSMDMAAEKALNQVDFYKTAQAEILRNITENIKNQSDSDLYGNGLLKYERSVDEGEESDPCIWENKYIITNKEQFTGTLDEILPCLRIVLPNPTESLTVIGREILNYCSNYGEDVNRK